MTTAQQDCPRECLHKELVCSVRASACTLQSLISEAITAKEGQAAGSALSSKQCGASSAVPVLHKIPKQNVNKWSSRLWRQLENRYGVEKSAFGKKKHAVHLFYVCSYSLETVKASQNTSILLFSWPWDGMCINITTFKLPQHSSEVCSPASCSTGSLNIWGGPSSTKLWADVVILWQCPEDPTGGQSHNVLSAV